MDGTETLDGERPLDRSIEEGQRFARRMYLPRVLGLGLGAACIGGGLWEIGAPLWQWLILAAHTLVWPHFAYRLARRVRQTNDLLSMLSTLDGLTRLPNRMSWEQAVANEFQRCRRIGHSSAVMMLDIDHFKSVNDTHGHPTGDAALRAVASILRDSLRLHDVPGRYGGEEFGVVLPGIDEAGPT